MPAKYTIGLDYGTNSVRALIVNVANGAEVAAAVWNYAHGNARRDSCRAIRTSRGSIRRIMSPARRSPSSRRSPPRKNRSKVSAPARSSASAWTPPAARRLPVDANGQPLAFDKKFAKNPAAMAWLWKDHTGVAEAAEITALAKKIRPQYLAKCGGTYSSEWFFSKILHCLRTAPEVFNAAHSWIELSDFVPAALTGTLAPDKFIAGVCAAGHKAMWNAKWGGYPDEAISFASCDPKLGATAPTVCRHAFTRLTARSAG